MICNTEWAAGRGSIKLKGDVLIDCKYDSAPCAADPSSPDAPSKRGHKPWDDYLLVGACDNHCECKDGALKCGMTSSRTIAMRDVLTRR